jgi:3-carboxy-cis,cis-muconate cycloisomerase
MDAGLLSPVWAGTEVAALVRDEDWLAAMLTAEAGLAAAQATLGVIPSPAAAVIASVAARSGLDLVALAVKARDAANPVVGLVSAFTAEVAGTDSAAAEYVHKGGTSQDILDTAAMLVASRAFAVIDTDLRRTAGALTRLAAEYRLTPMAGRTLTQHAVPVTFGLKAAGWLSLVLDSLDRVGALTFPASLGGAAGTQASYVEAAGAGPEHGLELATAFASALGLADPGIPWHALRTPLADIASVTTHICGALGKLALDVQGMTRTEVAEVAEPTAEGRGISSAMPQKQNPVLAAMIMSAARQVPLYATVLQQSMVCEDERSAGAWHAEWQALREVLRLTGGAAATAAELAEGLRVFPDRLRANLELTDGAVVSERLSMVLAPLLGKTAAKKLLGRVALAGDGPFEEALLADPEVAEKLDAETVRGLLDPSGYLGSSGLLVDRVLERARSVLA